MNILFILGLACSAAAYLLFLAGSMHPTPSQVRIFDLFPWLAVIGLMLIVIGGVGSIWQWVQ